MQNIYALNETQLTQILKRQGHPTFRAKQITNWIYSKGVCSFNDMSNLPKSLRYDLSQNFCFGHLELAVSQISKDGTEKRTCSGTSI